MRKGLLDLISLAFKRAVDELKLNEGIVDSRLKIYFHSCRHSYASWMIEQGADLYTFQKLLGHKTNVMTQGYAHHSGTAKKEKALQNAKTPMICSRDWVSDADARLYKPI